MSKWCLIFMVPFSHVIFNLLLFGWAWLSCLLVLSSGIGVHVGIRERDTEMLLGNTTQDPALTQCTTL